GEFDGLLAPGDVDGQAPSDLFCAVERRVNPPATGRDGEVGLPCRIETHGERRATLHAAVEEIVEAHAGATLGLKLAPHGRRVHRVKLHAYVCVRCADFSRPAQDDVQGRGVRL